jgi:DNA-damage-inducible protein J
MSDSVIRARIEPGLKAEATSVLKSMGLTPSDAIRLFLHRVVDEKALPFAVKPPNAETRAALRDAESGRNIKRHASVDTLLSEQSGKPFRGSKGHSPLAAGGITPPPFPPGPFGPILSPCRPMTPPLSPNTSPRC